MISISLREPWLSHLISGEKTVEGRLYKGKFTNLHEGDRICVNGIITFKLARITRYKTFDDMLHVEGIQHVLPEINDIQEGVKIYHQLYSCEDIDKQGVVALVLDPSIM